MADWAGQYEPCTAGCLTMCGAAGMLFSGCLPQAQPTLLHSLLRSWSPRPVMTRVDSAAAVIISTYGTPASPSVQMLCTAEILTTRDWHNAITWLRDIGSQ